MSALEILKIIAALFSVLFGIFSIWQPNTVAQASQFTLNNARGRVEMRIVAGGFFIGMGIGAILLGSVLEDSSNIAYQAIGISWLGGALTRLFNLFLEKPADVIDTSFWALLASEVIPAIIFILPA